MLSLFSTNSTIKEKQVKKIVLDEIKQLLSRNRKKSRNCSIIRNFEIMDETRLSDITINIFKNSNIDNDEYSDCIDIWNIGLIVLFMIYGKNNIIQMIKQNNLNNLNDIQDLLWNLYIENKISTNLFDLLYFFMLIFGENASERQSRYLQIDSHLWFHK